MEGSLRRKKNSKETKKKKNKVEEIQLANLASLASLESNEPITRMSQRHLPTKTRQTNSEAKHQTTLSEVEFVNLTLVGFHSSFSAGAPILLTPNLVPRADFVRLHFDFTEQSTLETTPGIDQFDWLISFQCLS